MNLEIFNKLINNVKENDFVQNFMKELSKFTENNCKLNEMKQDNKYSKYWKYKNYMEDDVAAIIGISRSSAEIKYRKELSNAIEYSILKLAEKEGALYRKQFMANGPTSNPTYSIDKFENGKIEHLNLPVDKVPKGFDNEDIIFQYKANGSTKIRTDLKEKTVKLASESVEYLKVRENEKTSDYKREGHIYKAIEDDGYIFLKDLTEKRDYVLEDIDFVVDCYQGDGKYKVVDGEYKKISE